MKKKIIRREYEEAQDILLDYHPLLRRIYAARYIRSEKELDRSFNHLLPFQSLLHINETAQLLVEMIRQKKKILIIGDFDADGATSTAVAIRALRSFGHQQLGFLVPNRFAYGYGLTPELVAVAKQQAPDLIVTVDNGIANHAGVEAARECGIQVVITDHHLPAATLPKANAIVNPNQVGDSFPSKHLAGVGVIFYVMLAVRKELININWFERQQLPLPNMSRLLDLVALGTIADLVKLDQNNRILVYQGLQRIRAGQCIPGIVALLECAKRDFTRINAADLGFAVAARLNAAGRMDDMTIGIECLLTDDPVQARALAKKLDDLNDSRRLIEKDMQAQALNILNNIHSSLKNDLPRGLCLFNQHWHQGVIGILAARIKDQFNRPTIVFAKGPNNEIKGSARSISGVHIRDLLALIDTQHPHLIHKFGGHAMAAGLSIAQDNFEEFAQIFNEKVSQQVTETQLMHSLISDGELALEDYNIETAAMLRDAGPWGQEFPEPLFDDTFKILEQRIVGDKHLKLRLAKENKILDAMAFFIDLNEWPNHRCNKIHAVYRLDINEYKQQCQVQLIIEYLEAIH